MRAALAEELGGIDRVELRERPDPGPAAGQALVRVYGAGVGPWDVGFLSGGFPGLTLPFVPGQEIAGARVFGVASPANNDYLRGLGATQVFDYHAADWAKQVRAAVPGGVDLLLDGAGGQTRDEAIGAVRDGGRALFIVLQGPAARLERGITGEPFAAHVDRQRLEALRRLVEAGLRPQVEAVLPLDQAREALARVAGGHTRGKIALQIGP